MKKFMMVFLAATAAALLGFHDRPGQAEHRPCGLAQGPDGALYVSDDVKGTIYKITYQGTNR